jgi:hypothetical protein
MEIRRTNSYKPQFQAQILINDERLTKFIRKSDLVARVQTEAAENIVKGLDNTTMVILSITEKDGKHYMTARNPKTRAKEFMEIANPNIVEQQDRFAYVEFINRLGNTTLNNIKKFWGIK